MFLPHVLTTCLKPFIRQAGIIDNIHKSFENIHSKTRIAIVILTRKFRVLHFICTYCLIAPTFERLSALRFVVNGFNGHVNMDYTSMHDKKRKSLKQVVNTHGLNI